MNNEIKSVITVLLHIFIIIHNSIIINTIIVLESAYEGLPFMKNFQLLLYILLYIVAVNSLMLGGIHIY